MTDKQPPDPNATIQIDASEALEEVDLGEAEVASGNAPVARRTAPPPLPPHVASQAPPQGSFAPPPQGSFAPAPQPRSPIVYVVVIVAVLGVGLGVGAFVTRATRKPVPTAAPSANPAVITIPLQEIDDSDAGP